MPTSSKGMPERLVATPWTMDKRNDSAAPGVPMPNAAASLVGTLLRAPPPAHSGYGPSTAGHHVFGSSQLPPDHPAAMLASIPRGMFGVAAASPLLIDPKVRLAASRPIGAAGRGPLASELAAAYPDNGVIAATRDTANVARKTRVVGSVTSSALAANGDNSARDFLGGGSQSSRSRDRRSDGGRFTPPSRSQIASVPSSAASKCSTSNSIERQQAAAAAIGLHTLACAAERRSTASLSSKVVSPELGLASDEPTARVRSSIAAASAAATAVTTDASYDRSVATRIVTARSPSAAPSPAAMVELVPDPRSASSPGPTHRLCSSAPPRTKTPPGQPTRMPHIAVPSSQPLQLPSSSARVEARVGVVITPSADADDAPPPFSGGLPTYAATSASTTAAGDRALQLHLPVLRSTKRPASAGPQATVPARHSVLPGGVAMLAVPSHVDVSGLRRPLSPLVTGGCIVAPGSRLAGMMAAGAVMPTVLGGAYDAFGSGAAYVSSSSSSEPLVNGCAAVPLDFSKAAAVRPASASPTPSVIVSNALSLSHVMSTAAAASTLAARSTPDLSRPVSAPAAVVDVDGSPSRDITSSNAAGSRSAKTPQPLADHKTAELAPSAVPNLAPSSAAASNWSAPSLPARLRADSLPAGSSAREKLKSVSSTCKVTTHDAASSGRLPFQQAEKSAVCEAAAASRSLSSAPRSPQESPHSRRIATACLATDGISLKPFNQRLKTLSNFQLASSQLTPAYRQRLLAAHRSQAGCIVSTSKSLDLLRCSLQKLFNAEVDAIMKNRVAPFLRPAWDNCCANNNKRDGRDVMASFEQSMESVYCQLLDEAKKMYIPSPNSRNRSTTPDCSDAASDAGSTTAGRRTPRGLLLSHLKRRYSDTDSEASATVVIKKRRGRPPGSGSAAAAAARLLQRPVEPVRRDITKWNPDRIKPDQLFIMGARANKALGLGATRGRLYIKHPEVFKYTGDQDDKQWLFESHLLPATGGKAYILLIDDVRELAEKDEYKNCGSLMLHELRGFKLPDWMLSKVKAQMTALLTEGPRRRSAHGSSIQPAEAASLSSGGTGEDNMSANATGLDSSKATPTSIGESPYPTDELLADDEDGDVKQGRAGGCVPFLSCGEISGGGSSSSEEEDDDAGGAEEPEDDDDAGDDNDEPPPLSAPFTMTEPPSSIGELQQQ